VPGNVSIRPGRPNQSEIAWPRPPTDQQLDAYLSNRCRDPHDLAERERAADELAVLETRRLRALDPIMTTAGRQDHAARTAQPPPNAATPHPAGDPPAAPPATR
jgi:hypothetical protein